MQYQSLFEKLHQHQIRYLISGGVAVNIYGVIRMTADIDIILDFEEGNLALFQKVIQDLNLQTSLPIPLRTFLDDSLKEKFIREKNMVAYSFFSSGPDFLNIDVLIDLPIPFEVLWHDREVRMVKGIAIQIVSIKHLIALKEKSGRPLDLEDVEKLSKFINQ